MSGQIWDVGPCVMEAWTNNNHASMTCQNGFEFRFRPTLQAALHSSTVTLLTTNQITIMGDVSRHKEASLSLTTHEITSFRNVFIFPRPCTTFLAKKRDTQRSILFTFRDILQINIFRYSFSHHLPCRAPHVQGHALFVEPIQKNNT